MTIPRSERAAPADRAVDALAGEFEDRFAAPRPRARRVGREAEFPVVGPDGRAGDVARLWPGLILATGGEPQFDQSGLPIGVETGRWFALAEVGRGTIEIGTGPRASLVELRDDLEAALGVVVPVAGALGLRLLGHGIQPRTPPGRALLTPKARYEALVETIGTGWLRWTVTASDQVHVDVGRGELIRAMNALNGCSGALIALSANSAVYGGRPGAASGREALSARVSGEPFRHGAVPRRFGDAADYVRWTAGFRALVLPDGRGGFEFPGVPYEQRLGSRRPDFDEWLYHEHYVWPSARPRARLGTLEIRPACQQPDASFAAAALSTGLVEANADVDAYLRAAFPGPAGWRRLLAHRRAAVRRGLGAPEPVPRIPQVRRRPGRGGPAVARARRGADAGEDSPAARRARGPGRRRTGAVSARGMAALCDDLAIERGR